MYRSRDSIKRLIRRQDFHWPPNLRAMFIPGVDCWNRSKLPVHECHTDNLYSVLVFLTISLSRPFEAGVLKPKLSTLGCITQSHLHAVPDSQVHSQRAWHTLYLWELPDPLRSQMPGRPCQLDTSPFCKCLMMGYLFKSIPVTLQGQILYPSNSLYNHEWPG